jgi:son of sevenless-like protein
MSCNSPQLIPISFQTFADPSVPEAIVLPTRKWKKMKKGDVLELVRMDPLEVAQHISLLESDLYRKIRRQECFLWSKTKEGDAVKNIRSFCAAHDRLADWVKCSILEVPALGKRANVVDFWIRVAEVRSNGFSYSKARLTQTVICRNVAPSIISRL